MSNKPANPKEQAPAVSVEALRALVERWRAEAAGRRRASPEGDCFEPGLEWAAAELEATITPSVEGTPR